MAQQLQLDALTSQQNYLCVFSTCAFKNEWAPGGARAATEH